MKEYKIEAQTIQSICSIKERAKRYTKPPYTSDLMDAAL